MKIVVTGISNCVRCGKDHERLEATKFERPFAPPEAGGIEWTSWATCPTTGDPILFIHAPAVESGGN